jgi:hypothetical protein
MMLNTRREWQVITKKAEIIAEDPEKPRPPKEWAEQNPA